MGCGITPLPPPCPATTRKQFFLDKEVQAELIAEGIPFLVVDLYVGDAYVIPAGAPHFFYTHPDVAHTPLAWNTRVAMNAADARPANPTPAANNRGGALGYCSFRSDSSVFIQINSSYGPRVQKSSSLLGCAEVIPRWTLGLSRALPSCRIN